MSESFKSIIEAYITESNNTIKETGFKQHNNSYFREFTHNEPNIQKASKHIENFLSNKVPNSVVTRIDDAKFIIIHPGGDLITNVNTYENKHYVATHYVSPETKDHGIKIQLLDNLKEDIRNQVIVRGNFGNSVHFRKKPKDVLNNNLQKLQQDFFSGHRPKH